MRALWTGAIGFGLVNIPIKIYSATQDSGLDLDMLDKKDHAHIHFKRVNEHTGKEVAWENIIKGYDLDGKMVVLDDKDFKRASAEKSDLIEIQSFIKEEEIDSMYYETPYYIEPQKAGHKAYALLRAALEKSKMVGLCSFVLRTKENLAILKASDGAIILNKIRFKEEIRDLSELKLPAKSEVKPTELKMAMALISQLQTKFDIDKYKDQYTSSLMKVIKAKAKGQKMVEPKLKVTRNAKKDLMDQLRESLTPTKLKRA
ncbi:MAG: Ku protein [Cytophagaceae bacterium]|nr:Ku protein [Cytophagaceae bacterium]